MRKWTLTLLACWLGAAAGNQLAPGGAELDPLAQPAATSANAGDPRPKRASSGPGAVRWLRMLQGMAGEATLMRGDREQEPALQPFWLPLATVPLDNGAVSNERGAGGVLVLPVPVPRPLEPESSDVRAPVADPARRTTQPASPAVASSVDEEEIFEPDNEEELFAPKTTESPRELVKQYQRELANIEDESAEPASLLTSETPAQGPRAARGRRARLADPQIAPVLTQPATPPQPSFERPLVLSGELYVRNAQYREPYIIWRDADGATRTELHGGATVAFRVPQPDNRFVLKLMTVDRSGGREVRRCVETPALATDAALRRHPALPDTGLFSFAGYARWRGNRVEVWRSELASPAGAPGAAPGEALTTRQELLVTRAPDNVTTPLKYTVTVESSVLGALGDKYEHIYGEGPAAVAVALDLDPTQCDEVERLRGDQPEQLARLEPLREFTAAGRDPRYDAMHATFKSNNGRKYVDAREEAVRKVALMQSARFVAARNRGGVPYALGPNFLSDRTAGERARLAGVELDVPTRAPEPFPHTPSELRALAARLPDEFDWREHGGVTPVRFQGLECKSCWAFAVTAAMEGAHFIRSRKLHGFSEQCFLDCAHPFGTRGCRGGWPQHAYEFANVRGLPARKTYTPYNATVLTCEARVPPRVQLRGYVDVPPNDVDALKVAIRLHAPVVVLVDSTSHDFSHYKSGVLNSTTCKKNLKSLRHAMVAVGWDNENGQTNFIVKNSWSSKWGKEGGYIRIQAAGNTCGILTAPSYPVLQDE